MFKRYMFLKIILLLLFSPLPLSYTVETDINIDELIINALNPNQDISDSAKNNLLKIGNKAIPHLLSRYKKEGYSARKTLGNLLINYGEVAVPYLEKELLGVDEDMACDSAIILGEIGAASISSLEKIFKQKKFEYNNERNMEAAFALGRIGPKAYPAMIKLISGNKEIHGTLLLMDALEKENKRATEYLLPVLKDPDPVRRYVAAIILGEYKDPISVQALIEALDDPDKAVCTQIVVAISKLGNRAKVAVPFIIKRLNELRDDYHLKVSDDLKNEIYVNFIREAIYTLQKIGADSKDVVPILKKYMTHKDSMIRSAAIDVVGNYPRDYNFDLIKTLKDASSDIKGEVRQKALESFNKSDIKDYEIIKLVILKLNDSYPSVRESSVKTLGKFKENPDLIIPKLITALSDENSFVRSQAAKSLGEFNEIAIDSIPYLINATKDKDHDVLIEAINALGNIKTSSKEVLATLKSMFKIEDIQIIEQSANALQKFGISSVPIFIETLKDKEESVRKISAEKLGSINPKAISAVPNLIEALNDSSLIVIEAAINSLGNIGPGAKDAIPNLLMLVNHESVKIRKSAINALGNTGPDAAPDTVPVLIKLINSKDYELRTLSINVLGKFGPLSQTAVSHLVNIVNSDDINLIQTAINTLGMIGPNASEAVPSLIQKLHHDRSDLRAVSAQALGRMGIKSKEAIPDLLKLLYDDNAIVRYRTADALADIAKDIGDNKDVTMINQLENIAREFKANIDIVTEKYEKNEHYKTVVRTINQLKTLRLHNTLNTIAIFTLSHPIVSIIILFSVLWIFAWHLILHIKPIYLIRVNRALGHHEWPIPNWLGGAGKIKLRYLLYVGFLNYKDKVLDEWVKLHLQMASNRFKEKGSIKLREIYISAPVRFQDNPVPDLEQSLLKSTLQNENCCIVIYGEGGLGKSSLAYEICRWAMSNNKEERLLEHPMIPVVIENDLTIGNGANESPLMNAIRYQLQDITDSVPISDDFAEKLIRKKRVLVIIDHLSEMSKNSREAIIKELSELTINACIVTSRIKEELGGITRTLINPLRIEGEGLVVFLSAYLNKRNKRELFDGSEFIEYCHQFSNIIGKSPIIFAKFYAEQLIAHKEDPAQNELPTNLPDLMLRYLNDINKNVFKLNDGFENLLIHRDAKALAWESIKESLFPSAFTTENALKALNDQDAKQRLFYLERRLMLIESIEPSNDHFRFLIDPLAEYLASLFIIETFRDDIEKWENLLSRIDMEINKAHEIFGFISALKECLLLKATLNNIPDFVLKRLTRHTKNS